MTLSRGLFIRKDATRGTTPVEARLALAGLVTPNDVGGVLTGMVVSGSASWAYEVGPGAVSFVRGAGDGVTVAGNDSATLVPTDPAPQTGSRWDLIWAIHHDVDNGDADSVASFGVTIGVASGIPVKPYGSVPAGATVLAEAPVDSEATDTQGLPVMVAPSIVARGGVAPAVNVAARDAIEDGRVAAGDLPSVRSPLLVVRGGDILDVNAGDGWLSTPLRRRFFAVIATTNRNLGNNIYNWLGAMAPFTSIGSPPTPPPEFLYLTDNGPQFGNHIMAQVEGWFRVSATVQFEANATGNRFLRVVYDTAGVMKETGGQARSSGTTRLEIEATAYLTVGQRLGVQAFQNSGATRELVAANAGIQMTMEYLGS